MADPSPTRRAPPDDNEEGLREEQLMDREDNSLVIPADGHGWKQYGRKFIKTIGKTRNYFKCHKTNCGAKKQVEWSASKPDNIRIIYKGNHTHSPPISPHQQEASASRVNQYDLYTQVFGAQNNTNSS